MKIDFALYEWRETKSERMKKPRGSVEKGRCLGLDYLLTTALCISDISRCFSTGVGAET